MAEYFDLGTNINFMLTSLDDNNYSIVDLATDISSYFGFSKKKEVKHEVQAPKIIERDLLKVRESICIVGYNQNAVQSIKQKISALVDEPLPLESLHLKSPSDLKQGALLVPKVVLVATHCPGKKLIDDEGDYGQLDEVYDEVFETGADVLLIYLNLPRAIYPSVRHMVYHPRMAEIVFPSQPTLRSLAEDYSLITVLERSDFSSMQKNVMREWLMRPVGKDHPVYAKSNSLIQMTFSDAEFWSESELYNYRKPVSYARATQYVTSYEHKTASPEKTSKKKALKKKTKAKVTDVPIGQLIDLGEPDRGQMELELYNGESRESEPLVGNVAV